MKRVQEQSGDGGVAASIEARKWDLPETWKSALDEVGGRDAVPATYGDDEDAVATYAEELARRVRVAYPTQVVAALVSRGDLDVPGVGAAPMARTLKAAADEGFRLGEQSPAVFLDEHADVIQGLDADTKVKVTAAMETLHRVHQITPSNEAMRVLLEKGLNSAYDVVATSENEFLDRYGSFFPSRHQARLVYRKSEQVSAVLYNFHAMTKQAVSSSVLGAVQGTEETRSAAVERIRKAMPSPTMESLFGSMDYCECDHCGSVLGPAAYFVDLLKFLDPDAPEWQGFLDTWKLRHQGEDYPFATPYDELMTRRPDLAHLTLTCDNTSSVLPTIDLVNEILEFILAEGKLTEDTVHDSGMLSSAEVLAEPEFIESTVYDKVLRTAKSPHVLPFDLWHETTREFASRLGTPLVEILAAFAGDEEDELASERLGLTEVEYATITADDPMADWWTRFGYAAAAGEEAKALEELGRAKPLCRALGISYQDLVDLLGTRWVNPTLAELGGLTTARLSVADAVTWRNNKNLVGTDQPTEPGEEADVDHGPVGAAPPGHGDEHLRPDRREEGRCLADLARGRPARPGRRAGRPGQLLQLRAHLPGHGCQAARRSPGRPSRSCWSGSTCSSGCSVASAGPPASSTWPSRRTYPTASRSVLRFAWPYAASDASRSWPTSWSTTARAASSPRCGHRWTSPCTTACSSQGRLATATRSSSRRSVTRCRRCPPAPPSVSMCRRSSRRSG